MPCLCLLLPMSLLILLCIFIYRKIKRFFLLPAVPILEDEWWGRGNSKTEDMRVQPFEINIPDEVTKFRKF